MITNKTNEAKIAELEKLRNKAIEDKKKLDAKIKEYTDKIEQLQMQINNNDMNVAVKLVNELGGGTGDATIRDLLELVKDNPKEIRAMLEKRKKGAAIADQPSLSNPNAFDESLNESDDADEDVLADTEE